MKWAVRPLVRGLGTTSAKALHTLQGLGECYYVSPRGAEPGVRGRRLHHYLALTQRSRVRASGAPELVTTPSPYLDPIEPSEPLSVSSNLSGLKDKVEDQRFDLSSWVSPGNKRALWSRCLQRPSLLGPVPTQRPTGHRRTSDPSREGVAGGAVPALVTSQSHMQIERRHGLPGWGSQSGAQNAAPAAARGDRQRPGNWGRGACPEAPGAPQAKAGRNSPGNWGGAAGPGGAEVVVRRSVPESAADHRPGSIAGAGLGARRRLRVTALVRWALSLQPRLLDSRHKLERSNS